MAVKLTADTGGFDSKLVRSAGLVGTFTSKFNRATDSARAWKSLTSSMGTFKLAGAETLQSFQTTLAVARSELRRFGRNKDVQVAVEIGREYLSESWIRTRAMLQRLANRSGIKIAASVVASRTSSAVAWLQQQRRTLTKPITVRMMLARRGLDSMLTSARTKLDGLKRFRAVRIGIAAVNGLKLPMQAAFATLGPLRKLATAGLTVALKAAPFALAAGVTIARKSLSGLIGMGSRIGSALAGGFKVAGLAAVAIGGVAAFALTSLVRHSMEGIDATAKLSDRLGFTTESLVGLQHAAGLAGIGNEELTGGLEKMLNCLADAATKGGPAADSLRQLGLDAKTLAAGTPDAALKAIADGLKGIDNPMQRGQIAMDIFGKSGQKLLPLMMSGAEGIAAAQAEAQKLGLTFSRVDAAKVEAANDSITRMTSVITGVGNQIAIGLAPYIDAVAVKLTAMATKGGGIGPKIGGAIEWVVKAVATASDYLNLLKAGWKLLQAGATIAVLGVIKSIDLLGQGIVWVLNKLPGVSIEFTSFFAQMSDGLVQDVDRLTSEAGAAFDSFTRGDNARAAGKIFDDIRAKSQTAATALANDATTMGGAFRKVADDSENLKKIGETMADIEKQSAQLGMSESQKKIADLQKLGAKPDQIAKARELLNVQDQIAKLDKIDTGSAMTDFAAKMEQLQKLYAQGKITAEQFGAIRDTAKQTLTDKLTEQAKGITDSVKTPLESYQEELDKLNTLLEQGLITQQTFDRASAKAKGTLASAQESQEAPKAIRAGSAEAQRFVFDQARGVQKLTRDDIPKKQLAENEEQTKYLFRIDRTLRDQGTPEVVDL